MRALTACQTLPALSLAVLLAACAGVPGGGAAPSRAPAAVKPATGTPALLTAYDWDLVAMADGRGQADPTWRLPGQRAPRLHFEDGQVQLQHLCNVVTGRYTVAEDRLQVSPGVSTRRACADPALMRLEERLGAQLPRAHRLELRPPAAGGTPVLVLHFQDGSRWELAGTPTAQTRHGSAGERVFLEVAPERVPCAAAGVPSGQCLQVREVRFAENGTRLGVGAWQPLHAQIEGYRHEPGMRNVLRLHRYPRPQAGPGSPAWAYVLDMVVETERMR